MKEKPFFSWRQAILDSALEPNTKYVLLVLSTFMNDHGTGCYPSMETIAAKSGLSKRSVITHIQNASEAGFIVVKQHGFRGQQWRTNDYRIAFPKAGRGETVAPASTAKGGETIAPRKAQKVVKPLHHETHEAGAAISPASDGKVVQLVQEGGATDDTKVVKQLHSNSPMNSPMNSPVPTTGVVGENAPPKITNILPSSSTPFRIQKDWHPREHFADMLAASGLPLDYDWEPDWQEFVLFWAFNANCPKLNQSQWESKFRQAVLHNRTHSASKPTQLPVDWEPSPECWQQLREEAFSEIEVLNEIPNFSLYWRDDGSAQRSWNTKFLQWIRNNVRSAIGHPALRGV